MIARIVAAGAIAMLVSGCTLTGSGNAGELRDGAHSLVPPGSRTVEEVEGDCVELASSPSCVHVYYVPEELPLAERVSAVERAADTGGWELTSKEFLPGGANLRFRRDGLEAIVFIWAGERSAPCRDAPDKECADVIMVERT